MSIRKGLKMKNYTTRFITLSILTILLQGCNNSNHSTTKIVYPTAIGEAVSLTTDEKNTLMAPSNSLLDEVGRTIGNILKEHIEELNQKEVIGFSKETNYCDISGDKTSITSGTLENFMRKTSYNHCKRDNINQNGNINITYNLTDTEGKYPQVVTLVVTKAYDFNDMVLKKELLVESTIVYTQDKAIKEISLAVTGLVDFNYQTLSFKNFEQHVAF